MTPERLAADKTANRIAAGIQSVLVPVVLLTTTSPLTVWLLRGRFSFVLGCAYTVAALIAFIWPGHRWEPAVAGLGVTFWTVRAISLLVASTFELGVRPPWAEALPQAGLGAAWALFYWRTLFRAGFFRRLDEIEQKLEVDDA